MTFTAAVKQFFGLKEGQTLTEFAAELKQLTYNDKLEIAEMLRGEGMVVEAPTAPPQV